MEQSKQKEQNKSLQASTVRHSVSSDSRRCAHCGAPLDSEAAFCEECGAPCHGHHCDSCGAEIKEGMALCPVCGGPATMNCTFCGAVMSRGDRFCPDCGNPRGGITCPQCHTVNFRSFCRKCNHPLNPMALMAIEEARRDPRFIRATKISEEVACLEDEMAMLEQQLQNPEKYFANQGTREPAQERLLEIDNETNEDTRRLLEEFKRLSGGSSEPKNNSVETGAPKTPSAPASKLTIGEVAQVEIQRPASAIKENKIGAQIEAAAKRLEELKKQHAAKVDELQKELDAMVPPAGAPPEMKRNFACAHKVTIKTKVLVEERVAWVCNMCQIWHKNPSECGVRDYGGKWMYKKIEKDSFTEGTIHL